jgi:hypothetical protein
MVGEIANRFERNKLINLMEIVIDGISEPIVQTMQRG